MSSYHNIDKLIGNVTSVLASNRFRPEVGRIFWPCFPMYARTEKEEVKMKVNYVRTEI
jgi:hypothetical protein